ncbi:UrcA family protein [Sphingomonas sp. KRR8]|jgi:UrcA family protein|uniref:UrcA family protein n=1 Tax=Sphingomonas sp. KRR8 TaxID=2942996 RepID=UPI002020B449|nr:UrcA family protein [Sphingomonas sp. KRR8]URD59862.1 UrcA family protein [Sphingomonas sp. KRR8]
MRLLFLTAALAAAPAAAVAQPADTLVVHGARTLADNQQLVSFGDLKLASLSGQRALRSRVDQAITTLCDSSHFSVTDPQGSLKCANQAWNDIAPQLAALTPRLASR